MWQVFFDGTNTEAQGGGGVKNMQDVKKTLSCRVAAMVPETM